MFPLVGALLLAQSLPTAPPTETPETIVLPQEVRPLPGQLNTVPVFNSNSPEVVQTEGILLSTFPKSGKKVPEAHQNFGFQGRFDVFAHHIAKATTPDDLRTLYLGILLQNPGASPVTVDVLQAASYLSQPDAPFIKLPPLVENPTGQVYAGPGGRATDTVLRGQRQSGWPAQITLPPGESRMLLNVPIPVKTLDPPINGRSTLARLRSNGRVYAASLALFAKLDDTGAEQPPTLQDWERILQEGTFATPRDKTPTPPGASGNLIYSRVAGVAKGSMWQAMLTDTQDAPYQLTIPKQGQAFSYPLSALDRGTFGTGQIQTAPLTTRYADTAYAAHGNYGVQYSLTLPLYNPTDACQFVSVALQTPLKSDEAAKGLSFKSSPPERVFFRGTVRVRHTDDEGVPRTRYVHLVQFQGQQGQPLAELQMCPKSSRLVQVDFIYPPDATPPQVLTVQTLKWLADPAELKNN